MGMHFVRRADADGSREIDYNNINLSPLLLYSAKNHD